jgi:hypothetical protein
MAKRIRQIPSRIHPESDFRYDPTYDNREDIKAALANVPSTAAVKATGSIGVTGLPVADETITVNGVVFTFKASATLANHITIGTDADTTRANIAAKLNASTSPLVAKATYVNNGTNAVTVTHDQPGVKGNAFTLAENATNVTVSGATLTGGVTNRYQEVTKTFLD